MATRQITTIRKTARKTFHERLRDTLEACRKVMMVGAKIRWQLKNDGASEAFLQQQKNVKLLLSLLWNYDVESAPMKEQEGLQQQLSRIRALASAYNDGVRQDVTFSNVEKTSEIYWEFVFEMHAFCKIAAPEMAACYDDRLGVAEEARHRKAEHLCRTRGGKYAVQWLLVNGKDDHRKPSEVIDTEIGIHGPTWPAADRRTLIAVLSDKFGRPAVRKVAAKRAAVLRKEMQFLSSI